MDMKIKRGHIVIYLGVILFSWVIVGVSGSSRKNLQCVDVKAKLHNQTGNHFISQTKLNEILRDVQGKDMLDCKMGEIEVAKLENALEQNPYIKGAEVWKEFSGELMVELELRRPIARLMTITGSDFYLDEHFHKMDVSPEYTSQVMLVRGRINEPMMPRDTITSPILDSLKPLVQYAANDEFLNSQISEIVVGDDNKLTIYPEVGDILIHFGTCRNYKDKFDRLEMFYEQVLNKVGWEKYKSISLEYSGQVVARR